MTDPQNVGTIIETCQYLGIDKLLVNEEKKCGLTGTVSEVSRGALETVDLMKMKPE